MVLCVSALQNLLSTLHILRKQVIILKVTKGIRATYIHPHKECNIISPLVLRAVRIFRSVSFIRGLQVLVTALIATFLNAMIPLLFLLFILMFIFSIIGYYWFGYDETGDQENWGTIGRAMLSLFTFVTVSFPL